MGGVADTDEVTTCHSVIASRQVYESLWQGHRGRGWKKGKVTRYGESGKRRIEGGSQAPGLGGQIDKAYEEVGRLSWRGVDG